MKQTSETTFEPEWLALREPVDHAARDSAVLAHAAQAVRSGDTILDLGSGTGSTARAFAAAGFLDFNWRFFDNDPALLLLAQTRHAGAECVTGDLTDIDSLPLDGVGLITASALFDLMPAAWVEALMARAKMADIPLYAALSYDGVMEWTPADARDAVITEAFNRHQCSDKGFGRALGPNATDTVTRCAASEGCDIQIAQSPWQIGPDAADLHVALLRGIAEAADEAGAWDAKQWGTDRCAAAAHSHAVIGHTDLLVIPQ